MITTTSNFDTYNTAANSQPVWIIKFSFSATYFSSGTWGDIGSYTVKKNVSSLTHIGMKVDMLNFNTNFGGYDFTILDIDDDVRNILSNDVIGDSVTIYVGDQSLDLIDFMILPKSKIKSYGVNKDLMSYWFKSRIDLLPTKPIFQNLGKTYLTGDETVGDTTINVNDTTGFQTASTPSWDANGTQETYIIIDDEVMEYTNTAANTFTVVRGSLGTRAQTHRQNTEVYEVMYTDNIADGAGESEAFDFFAGVLTSTNGGSNGDYDNGVDYWGLGIDEDTFDWNDMRNQFQKVSSNSVTAWIRDINLIIIENGVQDGLKWVEDNFLKTFPAFFYLTEIGKVSVRFWDVYGNKDGLLTLTEDDIIDLKIDIKKNNIITHLQTEEGTENLMYKQDVENNTAWVKWGELKRIVYKNNYFSQVTGSADARFRERIFSKFGNPSVNVKFKTFLDHQVLQVGDRVDITHTKTPVFTDGSLGWTRETFEIIDKQIKYTAGKIEPQFEAINHLLNEKIDIIDVDVYELADMDDSTLSRDADHAQGTLQAADAYIDISDTNVDDVMVEIMFDHTAFGASVNETMEFYIKVQHPAGTDDLEVVKYLHYDESLTVTEKKVEFMVSGLGDATISRVRVDYTAYTGDGAHEPTNITLNKVKTIKRNYTVAVKVL